MDPQSHPLFQFLVRMKLTSTNVFTSGPQKNVKITGGKIWVVRRMLKYFPTKSPKLIPHQISGIGTGVITQKDDSVRQHSRAFWLYSASQFLQRISLTYFIDCGSTPSRCPLHSKKEFIITLPVFVWTALGFFNEGELRCVLCLFGRLLSVSKCGITFRPL